MENKIKFEYYYGIEAEQFSFYRVPRLLIKDERFKGLSSDAKLLYGLMLDRMSLSMKNGWLDEENRAYIIYTIEDIMEDLGCARGTCAKIIKELEAENGIGLIEKKRRGLGKPDIIYVKNFATLNETTKEKAEKKETVNADVSTDAEVQDLDVQESENCTSKSLEIELPEIQDLDFQKSKSCTSRSSEIELPEIQDLNFQKSKNWTSRSPKIELPEIQDLNFQKSKNCTSRSSKIELPEIQDLNFQKSKNCTSRNPKIELPEVQNLDPNYTNYNYTKQSYMEDNYTERNYTKESNIYPIHPIYSINPSESLLPTKKSEEMDGIDRMDETNAYMKLIRENLDYEGHMKYDDENSKQLLEEIYHTICDVVCVKRTYIRINGEDYPYELVKSRFLKLDYSHIVYVMDRMKATVTKITNIRAYLITALYNAPSTINHHYQQMVQHDMYGGGWQEKGIV